LASDAYETYMTARLTVPARISWAVEQLQPAARDRILEIGCGGGHALARIAALAPRCAVVGIDRSALQVQQARARLRKSPAAAGWKVERVTLVDAVRCWPATFDKVFAINVNAFWVEPAKSLPALAGLLAKSGRAYLVYEPPSASRAASLEADLGDACATFGFQVRQTLQQRFTRSVAVCFIVQRGA
jgi:protein-L-isoaspartate O-methyltransferase